MLEFSTILIGTQNHTSNFVNSALTKEIIKEVSNTMHNVTGNVRVTQHSGTFFQPLLQWKNNKYLHILRAVDVVSREIQKVAQKHERRLHQHEKFEAIQLLDNVGIVRRLQREKPFELV
jgi:hypothetical protein